MDKNDKLNISDISIEECIKVLEKLAGNSIDLNNIPEEQRVALMSAAGKLSRPDRNEIKRRNKEIKKAKRQEIVSIERKARANTGIRSAREAKVFSAPLQISSADSTFDNELKSPRNCYICKAEYTRLHHFYDSMCPSCADFNYKKRFQTASLDGQVAVITGSRLKIGYQATLMMLRAGSEVIATTRFPVDSALRYSKENDFLSWKDRLHIYGLDLRHTPSIEIFCSFIEEKYKRLDILINNAAQTVRRPPGFYSHLMANESIVFDELPKDVKGLLGDYKTCIREMTSYSDPIADPSIKPVSLVSWSGNAPGVGLRSSAQLSQVPYPYDHTLAIENVFPEGEVDADLQQVDLRETNSWRLKLGEVEALEMIEIQLVNAIAPFVLCNRLAPLMKQDYTGQKHIVNVSAMEGKFFRFKTTGRHPHTNMAKAALNMLTHTSASDLAKYGIYMNAVDTGWVTDEDPAKLAKLKEELHDFQPPLDIVDGAARVCDPFFDGILTGKHWCGKFLKDYFPIDW